MFPSRYFPDRYFAPRYWPKVGSSAVVVAGPFSIAAYTVTAPGAKARQPQHNRTLKRQVTTPGADARQVTTPGADARQVTTPGADARQVRVYD